MTLSTRDLQSIFAQEIAARGGEVLETFDDGERLFTRSVLPRVREVRSRDQVQGGVALKSAQGSVWVHPYLFRQVCRNGAILAQTTQTRLIDGLDWLAPDVAEAEVREAVGICCLDDAFSEATEAMRSAQERQADLGLNMLPMMRHFESLQGHRTSALWAEITSRFFQQGDRTQFGLINAVTATARDTRDPEVRWRLEEFGGGMCAPCIPTLQPDDSAAALAVG